MRYISLFAGIGGFDLALERLGHECVYVNEWDKYAAQIYEKNFRTNICRCDRDTTKRDGTSSTSQQGIQPAEACLQCRGNITNLVGTGSTGKIQYPTVDTRSITEVSAEEIPDHDLLVGGFPCQSFSIAGKRRGFADTRGTLFYDICRILDAKRPTYLLLENVKGLLSHDSGKTFETILRALTELGYDLQWQVCNSKNFGVPQNRERVYIVGHLRGKPRPEIFPLIGKRKAALGGDDKFIDLQLEGAKITDQARTIQARYYKGYSSRYGENSGVISGTLRTHKDGNGFREVKSGLAPTIPARAREDGSGQPVILQKSQDWREDGTLRKFTDYSPTIRAQMGDNHPMVAIPILTPDRLEKRQNGRRFKTDGEPSFTLTAQDKHGVHDGRRIRRLTPLECERLQGFPDGWTEGVSDTQRYKMLGNAVTVNTVEAICQNLPQRTK